METLRETLRPPQMHDLRIINMTVRQIESMRRDMQDSVLDALMTANQDFLDSRLKQEEFALAHEIARVLKNSLSLTEIVLDRLKSSSDGSTAETGK
ncbi:hypothetical protein L2U69_01385 [Zavarzinia compransoris]|uniref:hypothetical protein n=1 Tax=Zavarzinia marina TaxID=2911065 RepID=UPI001F2C68CB|nr:hypothetical protein [Zavarzinia marina]MCF4164297.1 hypothetical protein [Zavarzinia marina]